MKIIYNKLIPIKGFKAVNLFGAMFVRRGTGPLYDYEIRHEQIHTAQMRELFYVGFYGVYLLEWLYRCARWIFTKEPAYHSLSFEREAYAHQYEPFYLENRKHFAQWRTKHEEI